MSTDTDTYYLDESDGPLDEPDTITPETPRGTFAESYGALRRQGWPGVLWLPEGEKAMPLGAKDAPLHRSLTGYSGVDCDTSELHLLATSTIRRRTPNGLKGYSGARGNVGLRAVPGIVIDGKVYDQVFLDNDDYEKGGVRKNGTKTIRELEAKAGVRFPPTCAIGSRGDDDPSKKYSYLVERDDPEVSIKLVTSLPDVELIQWFHRYAVAPPSVNPHSGNTAFRAYRDVAPRPGDCSGTPIEGMFRPEESAVMPRELVAELTDESGFSDACELADGDAKKFLDALRTGERCKAVAAQLDTAIKALAEPGSRHEATLRSVLRLLRLGEMGHVDVPATLVELENAFVLTQNAPSDTEQKARGEFRRMIENKRGIGLILAEPTADAEKGCRCGPWLDDESVLRISTDTAAGLGISMVDLIAFVGHERYDRVMAAASRPERAPAPRAAVLPPQQPAPVLAAVLPPQQPAPVLAPVPPPGDPAWSAAPPPGMRLNAAEQAMVARDNAAARAEADAAKVAFEAAKAAFEAAKAAKTTPTPTTSAAQPAATPATEDDDTEPDSPAPATDDDTPADDQDEPTTWSTLRALWAAPGEGAPSSLIDHTNDDRGNGERFVHYWGNRVAWVPEIKATRLWNGATWQTDTSGSGMRHLAERMTDFMLVDARLLIQKYGLLLNHLVDEERSAVIKAAKQWPRKNDSTDVVNMRKLIKATEYDKWGKASRMDARLKACIVSAQSHPGVTVKAGLWDADPRKLAVANGTLVLNLNGTITFREHRAADRLTQQAAVIYDPAARCPRFDGYLTWALPKAATRRALRAFTGLSLLGNNDRHIFPVLIGKTRSGKTTYLEVMAGVLDNPADPGAALSGSFTLDMMRPKGNGAPNADLFRVIGRRFIYCSETSDGLTLSGERMKRFSGGDRQSARDTFDKANAMQDRKPAFTPFLGSNQAPQIEGADAALRERLPAIPFDQYRKPEDRDPDLVAKIVTEEASGVLNYLLAGHVDAITNPMVIRDLPQECVDAAAKMFQDMDVYARWIADEAEPTDDKDQWITTGEAWDAFVAWGSKTRELMRDPTITRWRFGKALTDAGHPRQKVKHDGHAVNAVQGLGWNADRKAEAAQRAAEARRGRDEEAARHGDAGTAEQRSADTAKNIAALSAEQVPESAA